MKVRELEELLSEVLDYSDKDSKVVIKVDPTEIWVQTEAGEIAIGYQKDRKGMTFGEAIEALKMGEKVSRTGWNGKDMFIFLVPGSTFKVNRPPLLGIYQEGTEINYHPHIDMKTANGTIVPWLASQTDVLAEDWEVV